MCGICGFLSLKGEPASPYILAGMTDALVHRGPDDAGIYLDNNLGFGFRRLAILDPSPAGHQPMTTQDGRLWIVYNGEIYNFLELRDRLKSEGYNFHSRTDTEVLLALFDRYREACLPMLNGMFAFAIWDQKRKELFVARDRFGIKPLVYYFDGNLFAFASEIKSLLRHPRIPREMDISALDLYLSLNYIPAPHTIYRGIQKLPPGHYAVVNENGLKLVRWYSLVEQVRQGRRNLKLRDAKEELKALLSDSVKIRLISDVPLGAFLSGGIDSSIVVTLMAEHAGRGVETFSIGYKNNPVFDESEYARLVAQLNHTQHYEHLLTPQEVLSVIPKVLDYLDEPFADPSVLPTYLVSQVARSRVTVTLAGDGGDEVFGGYTKYLGEYFYRYYRLVPAFLRRHVIEPWLLNIGDSRDSSLRESLRQLKKFVYGSRGSDQVQRHFRWMTIYSDEMRASLLHEVQQGNGALAFVAQLYDAARCEFDPINQMLYTDVHCCLPYDMLTKVDWMSMQHSLEVRVPFLDHRVVELAFRIRGSEKIRRGETKYVLKKTFEDLLPGTILRRRKQGFDIPIGEWFKSDLRNLFWQVVNREATREAGLSFETIADLYAAHVAGRTDHSFRLWNIFTFLWWFQTSYQHYRQEHQATI